jgi:aerobic-type carbon monoxide dehydrogenase small subunit (CoxS/CutS family)
MPTRCILNGGEVSVEADPSTSLLRVLRNQFALTGMRYGRGAALYGATARSPR